MATSITFILFFSPFDLRLVEVFVLATGRAPEEELPVWLRCETVKRRAQKHRPTPLYTTPHHYTPHYYTHHPTTRTASLPGGDATSTAHCGSFSRGSDMTCPSKIHHTFITHLHFVLLFILRTFFF